MTQGSTPGAISQTTALTPLWQALGSLQSTPETLRPLVAAAAKLDLSDADIERTLLATVWSTNTKAREDYLIQLLEAGIRPRNPQQQRHLLVHLIDSEHFDLLAVLASHGVLVQADQSEHLSLARKLGHGKWPHPELIAPDLLLDPGCFETMASRLAMLLAPAVTTPDTQLANNGRAHLERMMALSCTPLAGVLFTSCLTNILAGKHGDKRLLENGPIGNLETCALLLRHGWLDEGKLTNPRNPHAGAITQALADGHRANLERDTAPTSLRHRRAPRL